MGLRNRLLGGRTNTERTPVLQPHVPSVQPSRFAESADVKLSIRISTRVRGETFADIDGARLVFRSDNTTFTSVDGETLHGYGLWPYAETEEGDDWISYDDEAVDSAVDFVHIRVAGITFRNAAARNTTEGAPLESLLIEPEPTNPVDRNALAIHTSTRNHQIGYVKKTDQVKVRTALAKGWLPICGWEWRNTNEERCAMHVLIASPLRISEFAAVGRESWSV